MSKSLLKWLVGAVAVVVMIIVACSQQPTEPVTSANSEASDQVVDHEALAKQYEKVIAAMDPYVTEQPNGEYVFDEAGFTAANASLPEAEQKLASELKAGIPIVNAEIDKDKRGEPTALASYCSWHWWGKTCCYTGQEGWQIVTGLAIAGSGGAYFVPLFGAVSGALAAILNHYMSVYGGFCMNYAWGGLFWISRP